MTAGDGTSKKTVDLSALGGRDDVDPSVIRLDLNVGASAPSISPLARPRLNDELRHYGQEDAQHLRTRIAELLHERHGCDIDATNIAIGAGSMALLRNAVDDTMAQQSPVVLSVPGYAGMRRLCESLGAETLLFPREPDGGLDLASIIHTVAEAPQPLIALNHPVNPTGLPERISDISALLDGLPNAVLLIDEAYQEYSDSLSALDMTDEWDRVIVVRTFSKARGMAGLRLGYAITAPTRVHQWMTQEHPGAISRMTQTLALQALEESTQDFAARITITTQERERVADAVRTIWQVEPWPSEANFLLVPLPDTAESIRDSLVRHGVTVRLIQDEPGLPDGVRISIGTPEENELLIRAMRSDGVTGVEARVDSPWPHAHTFCQFIGWPRSGTTLMAALLNAHPEVCIAHEADVSMAIAQGADARTVATIMESAQREFDRAGRQWFGYDYRVEGYDHGHSEESNQATVVGDKKAGGTAEVLALHPGVLERTHEVIGLPLRLLVVARDPFDTITTISRNLNGDLPPWFRAGTDPVDTAIDWYFLLATITQRVIDDPGIPTHVVRFADVIANPRGEVSRALRFLGVDDIEDGYLSAVEQRVFETPNRPSAQITWSGQQQERIIEGARSLPIVAQAMGRLP